MNSAAGQHRLIKFSRNRLVAISMSMFSATSQAKDIERQLHYVVTVDAQQSWKKSEPKTGEEWSKATTTQRYEVTTTLKSDGKLEVRNLEDLDLNTRLEAKTIWLARLAKKEFLAAGKTLPKTPEEVAAFSNHMQEDLATCNGDRACLSAMTLRYAAIFAAFEYPQALEEDTVPGTFYYFLPYRGCVEKSRVTLEMQIDGVRYNKDVKRLVPFSEHRAADSIDGSDGILLCEHFGATIDTQDKVHGMYLDNVFIPRPIGITTYTENGHTSNKEEPQPVPSAAVDWLAETLRHAAPSGSISTTVPVPLSLNGNSTWLGLWQGTAKVTFQWSFSEVGSGVAK